MHLNRFLVRHIIVTLGIIMILGALVITRLMEVML